MNCRTHLRFVIACLSLALVLLMLPRVATAYPTLFSSRCASCHTDDTTTCNGCHHHRGAVNAVPDKSSYQPGEAVVVTLTGGSQSGWIRGLLYDAQNTELDRKSGPTGTGDDSQGGAVTFPVTLNGTAPATAGSYTWRAAWYGNTANSGSAHGEVSRTFTVLVVEPPADVTDPPAPPVRRHSWGRVKALYGE
ncbi:MAG: hypothetical protein IT349_05575 [Candidatus Eisenbacteria bacterium]|nr:hypothetical protein [Candidatus Eisenbacteria bacterium]MCC7141556.1 hypothetical protein [Candidatus Eisenbacteria bacterium]